MGVWRFGACYRNVLHGTKNKSRREKENFPRENFTGTSHSNRITLTQQYTVWFSVFSVYSTHEKRAPTHSISVSLWWREQNKICGKYFDRGTCVYLYIYICILLGHVPRDSPSVIKRDSFNMSMRIWWIWYFAKIKLSISNPQ